MAWAAITFAKFWGRRAERSASPMRTERVATGNRTLQALRSRYPSSVSSARDLCTVAGVAALIAWAPSTLADGPPERLQQEPVGALAAHYHPGRAVRGNLILAGTIVVGVAYGLGVIVAADSGFRGSSSALLVPVAGPIIAADAVTRSRNQCGFTPYSGVRDCNSSFLPIFLIGDAVVQGTGVLLIAAGIIFRDRVWVRNAGLTLVPTFGAANGPRVGVVGTF
jgi:hypothetical protein